MKKKFIYFILIITILFITGCQVGKQKTEKIFTSLKNEGIIGNDLSLVKKFTSKTISININSSIYYIYKDKNNTYLGIKYSSCNGDYLCDSDYKISIYNVKLTDDEIIYINEDEIGTKEKYYIIDNKYAKNINNELTLKNE